MTRDQAIEKIRKLIVLGNDPGAKGAEALNARRAAERLAVKFQIRADELANCVPPPEPPRRRTAQTVNAGGWSSATTTTSSGGTWYVWVRHG
jgi:hypothetical protein